MYLISEKYLWSQEKKTILGYDFLQLESNIDLRKEYRFNR